MKKTTLIFVLFCFVLSLQAKIELSALFTDNMVLQQRSDAPIWGKATPGKDVKVITSWDDRTYSVKSDNDGHWKLTVKTPAAGGPYTISISDGKAFWLNNVMIGEVWICSGQSNMEMPLAGWGKILNYEKEIAEANYPNIRLLQADRVASLRPVENLKVSAGGWQVCSPATISEFSSTAYFFGRNLHQNLENVPIGLIHASWGGTIAEAWTSAETLNNMPYFKEPVQKIKNLSTSDPESTYKQELAAWESQVFSLDKGFSNGNPVWSAKDLDDTGWKTMMLPVFWEDAGVGMPDFNGIVWFRKTVDIPAEWQGKELELSLEAVDDNDITYFNGEKIGTTEGYTLKRVYKIPSKLVKKGTAVIAVRVFDGAGRGGIYGEAGNMRLSIQSNKKKNTISLANEWKYKVSADYKDLPKTPRSPGDANYPTVLFNAMIHPVIPYAIRGAIWYQGEANTGRAYQYRELFPLLIRDWRKQWNADFPFYFVQLANFMERNTEPVESEWAELREAQLQTLNLENTGMAVTIDIGDGGDIHPKDKQSVGNRLALAARANTYKQNIVFSGPIYESYRIENGKIRISFKHTDGGLKAKDNQTLKGFAIAGSDHQFRWANAVIDGNTVVVSSPGVSFPVAVRYAWANNPECNLYNGAGLPASPFRTDEIRAKK